MDSDVSLNLFVSRFRDLSTSEREETQSVGPLKDLDEGVVHDMRKWHYLQRQHDTLNRVTQSRNENKLSNVFLVIGRKDRLKKIRTEIF